MATRGRDDVQLEPPTANHADVTPAVEDRSYIIFIAGALVMALGGGFLLAILLPLKAAGDVDWVVETPFLTQAHGWAQLQGWAGLFVAGMAIRLMPRFAGRKPISARVNVPIFALLFAGVAGRTLAQSFLEGRALEVAIVVTAFVGAAGTIAVAAVLVVTLALGRKRPEPWRYLAWCGAAWWAVWSYLIVDAGFRAADTNGFVPGRFDDAMAWAVTLGAIGNFTWAVQSRSVPIFFGRKLPSIPKVAAPALLLNGGALLVLASQAFDGETQQRMLGGGLAAGGIALVWLAPLCGSLWGKAHRLRPRARAASRYVLAANIAAVVTGLLLTWGGGSSLFSGDFEGFGVRDAARHAFGLGLITMLIVGMAQLIAPMFALARAEARSPGLPEAVTWWGLVGALVLRVAAGLLYDELDLVERMRLAALAGVLAWVALAMFAATVIGAVRKEPAMKELLRTAGNSPKRP